ncbi:hypothetical protein CBR_g34401 [Chara braunii]|uniref:Reverse transcriptase RNase H-like domain-containing protein n=1 Tax=Chara braunii TaxID=69332 RepID=A0A388LIG5_CHABU|nr:hypothetical protein CBR_g34401 [Chara braunii]|eukprot:GBG82120.1 hypothetical protein CBR_g34401 [Chara braunii]
MFGWLTFSVLWQPLLRLFFPLGFTRVVCPHVTTKGGTSTVPYTPAEQAEIDKRLAEKREERERKKKEKEEEIAKLKKKKEEELKRKDEEEEEEETESLERRRRSLIEKGKATEAKQEEEDRDWLRQYVEEERLEKEGAQIREKLGAIPAEGAAADQQALLTEAIKYTTAELAALKRALTDVRAHQEEFQSTWNNYLVAANRRMDDRTLTFGEAVTNGVLIKMEEEFLKLKKELGVGRGERGGDDRKEGIRRDMGPATVGFEKKERMKMKTPWTYTGAAGENYLQWQAQMETYLYGQRIEPEERIIVVHSCLGGHAAIYTLQLMRQDGYESVVDWSHGIPVKRMFDALHHRFTDPTLPRKTAEAILHLHEGAWRNTSALKRHTDELLQCSDNGLTPAQLLNSFARAIPEPLKSNLFPLTKEEGMTYEEFRRRAVDQAGFLSEANAHFWKDLQRGRKWRGKTIASSVQTKDGLLLTFEEGGLEHLPEEQIEFGSGTDSDGQLVQGGDWTTVAARGGGHQGRGQGRGSRGRGRGRQSGYQGGGNDQGCYVGGRGYGPPQGGRGRSSFGGRGRGSRPYPEHPGLEDGKPWIAMGISYETWAARKRNDQCLKCGDPTHIVPFYPSLPFIVTTDASQYGIGVVLQQDDGHGYRPVEFMSTRLPSDKVAASTYERELYALREALDHWRQYLLGRHFKVYSDHETLRWLKTQARMTPKLTRWAGEIDQYDFELRPVKGKYNVVADALSRRSDFFGAIVTYLDVGTELQQQIKTAYAADHIYSVLMHKVQTVPHEVPNYRVTDGLLFEKTDRFDRLCIPNSEPIKSIVLGECHDSEGHFGWKKTYASLLRSYTWTGMQVYCVRILGQA